ncbi:DASH complex subunit Dad3-domain-containing protein [Xylariaceae sp. FL0255]|nr:DASH complex subunit Dad3-domain-containing protein [Xylariaceae sp. FL0255]
MSIDPVSPDGLSTRTNIPKHALEFASQGSGSLALPRSFCHRRFLEPRAGFSADDGETACQALNNPLLSPPELSPLEQEVLEEYERLAENMKKLASVLDTMANQPTAEILDGLRELERKTSLVFTLLKASVYSIVLQQEIDWGNHDDGNQSQLHMQQRGGGGGGGGGGRFGDDGEGDEDVGDETI